MKIDKKLNVVLSVDCGYVHSSPIPTHTFEKNFLPISKTFSAVYQSGLSFVAGPRVASMMLKKISVDDGVWNGPDGVNNTLMTEIRKLTYVIKPGKNGWEEVPFWLAIDQGLLSDEEISEVENELVFFTLASSMHKKSELTEILHGMTKFWGGQTTSQGYTEFARSLPISITTENTGEKEVASSIPS